MNIDKFVEQLAEKSKAVMEPGDYIVDGLIYCGNCHTPKQYRVNLMGEIRVIGCLCDCRNKKMEEEKARQMAAEERIRVDSLRVAGIADKSLRNCRFENANKSQAIEQCRRYANRWNEVRENNIGLLLWGDTGGGKTFAAACIANRLIDKGIPTLITSFPRILAAKYSDRDDLLYKISKFPALVIDDLGAERGTEAALEVVYAVIDERYKSGKPLIVTTNLPIDKIKHPDDVTHKRIYERVLEMCTPLFVKAGSYRPDSANRKLEIAKSIFEG